MKTIVLPGFSLHNRDWAFKVKEKLGSDVLVHQWAHWKLGGNLKLSRELEEIAQLTKNKKVDVIAKSVGTRVAMHLLAGNLVNINKLVLCGIPTLGEGEETHKIYKLGLSKISPRNVTVFQNSSDPLASYGDIKSFLGKIAPEVKIVQKPRSDHEYPYFEDFEKFLGFY